MGEAKHTPGPWRYRAVSKGGEVVADLVETANGTSITPDCATAEDARLIAGAPDLLAALESIVAGLGATEENDGGKRIWRAAFDAIAKATGA